MEVQQPGNLGLAASDLGCDLRLSHTACRGLPDGAYEFSPRPRYRMIGAVSNVGEESGEATVEISCPVARSTMDTRP